MGNSAYAAQVHTQLTQLLQINCLQSHNYQHHEYCPQYLICMFKNTLITTAFQKSHIRAVQ